MSAQNADVILVKPAVTPNGSDAYAHDYSETSQTATRGRITQVSAQRAFTVVGKIADNTWALRIQSTSTIKPGWIARVQRDDWSEYREFEVLTATNHGYHWHLTIQGTGQ